MKYTIFFDESFNDSVKENLILSFSRLDDHAEVLLFTRGENIVHTIEFINECRRKKLLSPVVSFEIKISVNDDATLLKNKFQATESSDNSYFILFKEDKVLLKEKFNLSKRNPNHFNKIKKTIRLITNRLNFPFLNKIMVLTTLTILFIEFLPFVLIINKEFSLFLEPLQSLLLIVLGLELTLFLFKAGLSR